METKECRTCGIARPLTEFGPVRSRGSLLRATCKSCRRAKYATNADAVALAHRERYATDAEYRKRRQEYEVARYRSNKVAIRAAVNERNASARANRAADPTARDKYRKRQNTYASTARTKLRAQVLSAYGGVCECCGEREPRFLGVDHRNGDGAAHRASMKSSGYLYNLLKKLGYPKDRFRLLCHNCNAASGTKGVCPHSAQAPIAGDTWQHMGYS